MARAQRERKQRRVARRPFASLFAHIQTQCNARNKVKVRKHVEFLEAMQVRIWNQGLKERSCLRANSIVLNSSG